MEDIGIEFLDIGFPAANSRLMSNLEHLIKFISVSKYSILPCCAGRTHIHDIKPIIALSEIFGEAIEPLLFIATSPIRQLVEDWDLTYIISTAKKALQFSISQGLKPTLVIEDATRSSPVTLAALYDLAIELGLSRITLCDTVGQSIPASVRAIVEWTQEYFRNHNHKILLDWHGHNDRGLAVINAMEAIEAGCDRIHGTALGIGERTGNTAIDQLLVNLYLSGYHQWDVTKLNRYVEFSTACFEFNIPKNYPVFGEDVFKTASGVHAAAMNKAQQLNNPSFSDLIYSSVPASAFSRKNEIEISYMSGKANVINWLENAGISQKYNIIENILHRASEHKRPLTDKEIHQIVKDL
jgi:2-isopropylmalate synthase